METFEMPSAKEMEARIKKKEEDLANDKAKLVTIREQDSKTDTVRAEVKRMLKEAADTAKAYVKAEGFDDYDWVMGTKISSSRSKGPSKPAKDKYRHPEDGRIGKHKGPRLQWVKEFIDSGQEDKILITGWND